MNNQLTILPAVLRPEIEAEIEQCRSIGQTARANKLRKENCVGLRDRGFQLIARLDGCSYTVDRVDRYVGCDANIPHRRSKICPLRRWLEALPPAVVYGIAVLKTRIDLTNLHIEYTDNDPILLYFLGTYNGREYYVELAQWE